MCRLLMQNQISVRIQYDSRLKKEMAKLRRSLQMQIELLRQSGTEPLEERLLETQQRQEKAVHEAHQRQKQ